MPQPPCHPTACVLLIPAFNPDDRLVSLVNELRSLGYLNIVVVDDGSHEASETVFQELEHALSVDLLRNEVNCGKGAALKRGFAHILDRYPAAIGAVTADADGQHLPIDIDRVAAALSRAPDTFVLGARQFEGRVPFRSKIGNRTTRRLLAFLLRMRFKDSQTGLRGIPSALLPRLVQLKTGRYEFELDMLLTLAHDGIAMVEAPITTVYTSNNQTSHFRPVADSIRIYRVMIEFLVKKRLLRFFKYSLSSILSTVVDYSVYGLLLIPDRDYVLASVVARVFSVATHFLANKYFTFGHRNRPTSLESGHYLLVTLANLAGSIALIHGFVNFFGIGEFVAKVLAQSALFLITYFLLRSFVFSPKQ